MSKEESILVVGSTGYVGTRLVDALLDRGYKVHAGFRNPEKLKEKPWSSRRNLIPMEVDVFDVRSLINAGTGCSVGFYLVHSMYGKGDFESLDRIAAQNMAIAAEKSGLKRIIYLGGLGDPESRLSKHLESRLEVSRILHQGTVPATTLRAAMIVGAGSTSFEIMRYLVDRLPAMVTPRWVRTRSQPIAISNVIGYLIDCLGNHETADRVFDIGGPDILSYQDLMRIYSEEAGLTKRFIVPFPILTPRLSSYWLSLVTPLPAALAKPLIEGLKNQAICQNSDIQSIIPQNLLSIRDAIRLALKQNRHEKVFAKDSLHQAKGVPEWVYDGDPPWAGGSSFLLAQRTTTTASVDSIWSAIKSVFGSKGWNYGSWLWPIRGYIDTLLGGAGMNPLKAHPTSHSTVDCWRILEIVPKRRIRLRAILRMPATMIVTIKLKNLTSGGCKVGLELHYHPVGLAGLLGWYGFQPFRRHVSDRLLKKIIRIAEN
jgi:uncharacterized protein YbjT (DUF2867 family)